MIFRTVTIALAFVGLMVGAGVATGLETIQYFVSFGWIGIVGIAVAGAIISVTGLVIIQLGSYYLADDHSTVFESITYKWVARLIDVMVTLTVFALGFVMIAGAGSTMNQQFGWPMWAGALLMVVLTLITGLLNVDKVINIIGWITPLIVGAVIVVFVYALTHLPVDVAELNQIAQGEPSAMSNWWISSFNYAGLVLITAVSMMLVIGGSYVNPREAGLGGLVGGLTLTGLLLLLGTAMFLQIDAVAGVGVPNLALFNAIHPALGTILVWIIYAMIFNTCVGQYYALGRRLSAGRKKRFYPIFATMVLIGFGVSFVGFEALMANVYPVIGYAGIVLAVIMVVAYLRDRPKIAVETHRRIQLRALFTKREHPEEKFCREDAHELESLADTVAHDGQELRERIATEVAEELHRDGSIEYDMPADIRYIARKLSPEEIEALPAGDVRTQLLHTQGAAVPEIAEPELTGADVRALAEMVSLEKIERLPEGAIKDALLEAKRTHLAGSS